MVQLRLTCLRLGEGSMAEVEIDGSRTVLGLKAAVHKVLFDESEKVRAPNLELFLAKGEDGGWLGDETDLAGQLLKGEIPEGAQQLVGRGEQILPSKTLDHWMAGMEPPASDQIHILVYKPLKRPRLENTQLLTEVPRIAIKGAEYVTLPGDFVAKCGLAPGGDLMLYCRAQVHELWEFLENEVVAKSRRGWIVGPPGTGKSACLLSFAASLDPEEWHVIWIHLSRQASSCCVDFRSKQKYDFVLATFELPRVDGEKLFVCVDGFRKDFDNTMFWAKVGGDRDRLVICSSMATAGKTNDDDDANFRSKRFFMYSWTQEEYIKAIADSAFYEKIAPKLDTTSDWEVNDDDDDDDEGQLNNEDKKMRAFQRKFYYAGGSCRFMFQYFTSQVIAKLRKAVNSAANKADLVRSCTGVFHSNSAHTLYGMQPDTLVDAGRYPVSSFAASLCAQECGEDVIVALASRLNKSSNPSVDGHLFEWLFLAAVPQREVKLSGANNAVDVLPQGNIFQFNPKKKFKTAPALKKKGEISGKHEGNKYDITYDDGEKDASVNACFIGILKGEAGYPQDSFEVGDRVRVEIPDIRADRSWLQPVAWNQGGYDAVYFDTKANKVIFIQLTRSDKHTFKMRFFKEVLMKLHAAGLTNPEVEIYFVVKPHQLMNFSIDKIDDRGAIKEFDERWTGTEEDHVKVRAFESNTG
jgi:hypothetical protein